MSLTSPQATSVPLYAGFWRRAAASIVDCLILIIPAFIIDAVFGNARALAFMLSIAVGCAYYAGFHSSARQATPGKMAFGVKVSDLSGARIGVVRGISRYFATWLSALILGIGYLMAAFTQKKRALHDMIAGTLVVNAKAESGEIVAGGGVMPVTSGVRVVSVLLIVVPFFGGILAGIAVPAYQDYIVRSKISEALTEISALRSEIQQAYAQKQLFKTGQIQVASPSVKSVAVNPSGVIVITLVPEVAGGGSIVYTPSIDSAGTVSWRCSSGGVPPKYLPMDCRQ
jgi:uncharacterized RDD family membrane protein YckC/Tfp pilus assembly major pilin PilA